MIRLKYGADAPRAHRLIAKRLTCPVIFCQFVHSTAKSQVENWVRRNSLFLNNIVCFGFASPLSPALIGLG
ncbi:hypothetical protein BDV06DRAFT_200380 [Aspergillus oleicola]